MANPEKKKAVVYARQVPEPEPDPERFIYLLDKWDGLEKALGADADVLVVAFPEVLGDTYTELVINLGRIAASGKSLGITKRVCEKSSFMVRQAHHERNLPRSPWGERTPPTNKLSSGIDVLSVETWITKIELAA